MKKILIHLHLYYIEYFNEIASYIKNLDQKFEYELYITIPKQNASFTSVLQSSFPESKIFICDNIGFDIYPFIKIIKSVNLDEFSYVIKLHTKRDIDFNLFSIFKNKWYGKSNWREGLLTFIKNTNNIEQVINYLNAHDSVGMHGGQAYLLNQYTDDKNAKKSVQKYINKLGYKFVAGAIFVAKAKVFKNLQTNCIDLSLFEASDTTHQCVQFAHIMERYLGYCVTSCNLEIKDCLTPKIQQVIIFIQKYLYAFSNAFVLNIRITKKGKLLVKLFKIPIFSKYIKEVNSKL